jgi:serine/threonine protein kinase
VAVKVLEKNKIVGEADVRRVTREIDILRRNRHPNIVRLLDVLDTPSRIYLVMEDCNGCVRVCVWVRGWVGVGAFGLSVNP